MNLLTPGQLCSILNVNEHTLNVLVSRGAVPCSLVRSEDGNELSIRFDAGKINAWLDDGGSMNQEAWMKRLAERWEKKYPEQLKKLREFDSHFTPPRKPKGYSLTKIPNKKQGFVYYVRYIEKGKLVPTRRVTHTNDYDSAVQFALENRERLLSEYHARKEGKEVTLYGFLGAYYKEGSEYLAETGNRGRQISPKTRSVYYHFMHKNFIPFLRKRKIKRFEDLTAPVISDFQDSLLAKGNKAETVNRYTGSVSAVFDHLVRKGVIEENPFDKIDKLKVKAQSRAVRDCYAVDDVTGVFGRNWPSELSRLLCMIIYTANLRNGDIEKLQVKDIIKIDRYHFFNVRSSKTENGVRVVPVHPVLYEGLQNYIGGTGKQPEDYLFSVDGKPNQSALYRRANADMGAVMGFTEAELAERFITFYSGRHYWKTLMNSEDLGEIEEYFMGHKVSNEVRKRYNHRDRQGKRILMKKTKELIDILDRRLFTAAKKELSPKTGG
jgi:integrase